MLFPLIFQDLGIYSFLKLNNIFKVVSIPLHLNYKLSFLPSSICRYPGLILFCCVLKMKPKMN